MAGASAASLAALPEAQATHVVAIPSNVAASAPVPTALSEVLYPVASAVADHVIAKDVSHVASTLAWESGLQAEAMALLEEGRTDVWDVLTRRFETKLIQTALVNTRGRRIEAAHKLGIGRNTITRKIQELNLE